MVIHQSSARAADTSLRRKPQEQGKIILSPSGTIESLNKETMSIRREDNAISAPSFQLPCPRTPTCWRIECLSLESSLLLPRIARISLRFTQILQPRTSFHKELKRQRGKTGQQMNHGRHTRFSLESSLK